MIPVDKPPEKIPMINRKLWVALASDQLKRRKKFLGRYAKACIGCLEILMCDGPIGLHLCTTLDKMQEDGLIKGIRKIPFQKLRRKYLPISMNCLIAYGLAKGKVK